MTKFKLLDLIFFWQYIHKLYVIDKFYVIYLRNLKLNKLNYLLYKIKKYAY